jgi:hypothetical protein
MKYGADEASDAAGAGLESPIYLAGRAILCCNPPQWRGEEAGVTFAFPPQFPFRIAGYI